MFAECLLGVVAIGNIQSNSEGSVLLLYESVLHEFFQLKGIVSFRRQGRNVEVRDSVLVLCFTLPLLASLCLAYRFAPLGNGGSLHRYRIN